MDIGIASAIGSVANGMMSYISAERAMEQDAEEAQRNRQFQEYMYNLQLNDSERLYNKYATPSAQRLLYEKAGLNPTLMMKSGGQLQSSPVQAGSVPSGSAGHGYVVNPSIDLSGLDQAVLTRAQADNIQEDTKTRMIENRFKVAKEYLAVQQQLSNLKLSNEERSNLEKRSKTLEIELNYMDDFLKARNESQKQDAVLKRSEAALNAGKLEYQNYMNKAFPATSEAQMRVMNAQVYNLIQSGLAAGASIEQIKANCAKLIADKLNVEQDTENKKQQYNVNKPNEILSDKEAKDLNNDPKENDIYHGLDMLFKYVLPLKRMFK